MGMVKRISEGHERSKAIYIVPLKALAMEKYEDLSQVAACMGWSVGLGIGDATAEAKNIDDCNILVCTSEKLDSLLRHRSELVADVCCVVADEFHLMNDGTRGPTLEINLTRLRHIKPDAQIIALSATVGNSRPCFVAGCKVDSIRLATGRSSSMRRFTISTWNQERCSLQPKGRKRIHSALREI